MKSRYLVPSIILAVIVAGFLSVTVPAFNGAKAGMGKRFACYKTLCEKHDTTFYHIDGPVLQCSGKDGKLMQLAVEVCIDAK